MPRNSCRRHWAALGFKGKIRDGVAGQGAALPILQQHRDPDRNRQGQGERGPAVCPTPRGGVGPGG